MRPQLSLVRAFVVPACNAAGYGGSVGNITQGSCQQYNGVSVMMNAEIMSS